MKKIGYIIFIAGLVVACSKKNSGEIDIINPTPTTYNITPILSKFSGTGLSYETTERTVIFTTQDLPDHTSPYWDTSNSLYEDYNGTNPDWRQNPGSIGVQNIVFTISLTPEEAVTHSETSLGPIGIARNGVVFFNQYAAGNSPLEGEINSFDQWLGHPAMTTYHYHIEPKWLTKKYGNDAFLGLLSDGFPIYGPEENGVTITNVDLDEYHGHTGTTVDFPDGIYHYHITSEDPYLNGNGYFGTPGNITR
ncbi:YHYH protein [uncultured Maribacter sp.]|uniref:YHYH protein n=1 Tax=uncultured Maribacter sp. TaxID=431308 RepID=UPI0026385C54|nr:YHYH protein [uncultured Maribacter sp.]